MAQKLPDGQAAYVLFWHGPPDDPVQILMKTDDFTLLLPGCAWAAAYAAQLPVI